MCKCVRCSTIFDPNTKSKLSLFGIDYHRNCMKCGCHNFEVEPWSKVPEEIKKEVIADFSKKPIREKIGESELDVLVKDSLKVCKYESEYNLIETDDYYKLSSSESTENGFDLFYNPELLRKFNDDQVKAIIRHEIFHPITIGFINEPEEDDLEKLYFLIYAEMINHEKHVNQIPNDIELRKIKQPIAYEAIGNLLAAKNNINYDDNPIGHVLISLERLIYYFYDDTKTIMRLIKKYDLQAIWELFSWVNHDMSYIQKNFIMKGNRLEGKHMDGLKKLLFCVHACTSHLKLKTLFLENKIEFEENFLEKLKSMDSSQQVDQNIVVTKIFEFWLERALQNT
jgi:hypothetical protein